MNERVIFAIEDYMCDLFEPSRNWPKYEFRKQSYARWAAAEILKRIQKQPDRPPIEIVGDFVRKTDEYSGINHDERNDSFIFYVAHDVTTDIFDILQAMN